MKNQNCPSKIKVYNLPDSCKSAVIALLVKAAWVIALFIHSFAARSSIYGHKTARHLQKFAFLKFKSNTTYFPDMIIPTIRQCTEIYSCPIWKCLLSSHRTEKYKTVPKYSMRQIVVLRRKNLRGNGQHFFLRRLFVRRTTVCPILYMNISNKFIHIDNKNNCYNDPI